MHKYLHRNSFNLPIELHCFRCYNIIKLKGAGNTSKNHEPPEKGSRFMNRSIIFRNANKLVKQGYSRSEALREAWRLAKLPEISVKVKGTAATEQRQEALAHLTQYSPELVSFRVAGEPANRYDPNAVAVIASVKGKGSFLIGYLARELAANISTLLRAGLALLSSGTVTGGYAPNMNYGARVSLKFA